MGKGSFRNRPCLCGSGVKTKSCHPDGINSLQLLTDSLALSFLDFYKKNSNEVDRFRESTLRSLFLKIASYLGKGEYEGASIVDKFLETQNIIINDNLKERLGSNNFYFWISLSRRISIQSIMGQGFKRGNSAILAKHYMENVIYKYSQSFTDSYVDLSFSDDLEKEDCMLIYELECIGIILQDISAVSKTLSKGAKLVVTENSYKVVKSDRFNLLINQYDDCHEESGFLTQLGIETDIVRRLSDLENEMSDERYIINSEFNLEPKEIKIGNIICKSPNMIPQVAKVSTIYPLLKPLEKYFKSKYKIDLLSFLLSISKLTEFAVSSNKESIVKKLFKTGYFTFHKGDLKNLLLDGDILNEYDISTFLSLVTTTGSASDSSEFIALNWPKFVSSSEQSDHGVVDLNRVLFFLLYHTSKMYRELGYKDDLGRGLILEDQCYKKMKSISEIKIEKNVKLKHEGQLFLEIDIMIEYQNVLIFLDCKSVAHDPSIDLGGAKSIMDRSSYLSSKISERDSKVKRLIGVPKSDNFDFRGKVIYSHIITAAYEWLNLDCQYHWWNDSLPRLTNISFFEKNILKLILEGKFLDHKECIKL